MTKAQKILGTILVLTGISAFAGNVTQYNFTQYTKQELTDMFEYYPDSLHQNIFDYGLRASVKDIELLKNYVWIKSPDTSKKYNFKQYSQKEANDKVGI